MKKLAHAMLLTAGLGLSMSAIAAGTDIPDDGVIDEVACTLLGEQVTINRSKDVLGAYQCVEATTTIAVGMCHQSGSRKARVYDCVGIDTDADSVPDLWAPQGCAAGVQNVTITDYVAYGGNSRGGKLAPFNLVGNCDQAKMNAIDLFQ